ncbi:GrpB family protein [Cohnella suwonensis]|uniref:GrpB family protein n=1 Tax=Cohnella suwonensis TaxID=696072 RepID=A0ABW0M0I4_9BACL
MKDPVFIEPYNNEWAFNFSELRNEIVNQVGTAIERIDHIGSTAVIGLAAKPIIDIQISILDLDNIEEIKNGLSKLGFHHRIDNDDLTKRYFRESQGMNRTHIHVRQSGSWSEQFNLLFRDYLREHEIERNEYAQVKYYLANQYRNQREQYIEGKSEIIWSIIIKANRWSQEIGWKPSKPDL